MSHSSLFVACAIGIAFSTSSLCQPADALRLTPSQVEAEAAKLRSAPPRQYEFAKALLGDVIRFLATDSGISFFSLPDGSPEADRLITFSLTAGPFQALETLCKANGLTLVLDGGIWYVRPADDKELIGKSYEIRHNAFERVTKVTSGAGAGGSGAGATMGTPAGTTGSSSGSGSGVQGGGVDLQGASETFQTQRSELINDIRAILDLPPDTGLGGDAGGGPVPLNPGADAAAASNAPTDMFGNVRKPKIIWKSDSNTLYVVATRLQHQWVEGYLEACDKPQPLIAIEVKFFETSRDPSMEFGVDWSGTFGQSGFFRQVSTVTTDPTTGVSTVSTNNVAQREGGYRTDLSNLLSIGDLNKVSETFMAPTQAVLSAQDLNIKLRAMLNDEQTKTVSYPRMVTTNNREVVLRSVVNQPVLGGSASTSLAGGSTTTSSISYLPIGTVINILPKKMEQDKINLNIAVTISSIISTTVLEGNPYPVATSRVYSAPVEINNGYTVAIGGLDEAKEREAESGIPVINKIPIFGYLFKTRSKQKNHKNLMIFITSTMLDAKGGGLTDKPEAILRQKPPQLLPQVPRLTADGGIEGGVGAMPNAVAYMRRSTQEIGQVIFENRGGREEWANIRDLSSAIRRLRAVVEQYLIQYPGYAPELQQDRWELGKLLEDLERQRCALLKKGYY